MDLGQTLNTLANVGVIAGIAFLATQIQQTNQIMQRDAQNQRDDRQIAINMSIYQDEGLAQILVRQNEGQEISAVEKLRLDYFYTNYFIEWETRFRQIQNGLMDASELNPTGVKRRLSFNPGMRNFFMQDQRLVLSPAFVEWMDENVIEN